jgi:ankyrin repeat protein
VSELHQAVKQADLQRVKAILAENPELVNAKDRKGGSGRTALHEAAYWAAHRDNNGMVELLVASGADVNASDKSGLEPLYYAGLMGQAEVVEFLISKGADVNRRTESGGTVLHEVSFLGNREAVEILVADGADVNVKDDKGNTPLHMAARAVRIGWAVEPSSWRHYKEVAGVLIAEGADLNLRNSNGYTPLRLAVERGCAEIAALLREHGAVE